jgi:hypothetical protein
MTGLLSAWAGSPQAREQISHDIQQMLQREDHVLDVTVLNILVVRSFACQNSVEGAVGPTNLSSADGATKHRFAARSRQLCLLTMLLSTAATTS